MKWPQWPKDKRNQFFKKVNEQEEETSTKIDSKVILQGAINFCNQLRHLKNDCPLNKKYKMKKKILVETWSDCYSSSSNDESMIEVRANFCLMTKEEKVCNKNFDGLYIFQIDVC